MRKFLVFTLLWTVAGLIAGTLVYSTWMYWSGSRQQPLKPASFLSQRDSYASGISAASPAVVSVYTSETIYRAIPESRRSSADLVGGNRIAPPERRQANQGSGVIVDPQGYVVTSHHLVQNADQIYVALADGRLFEAVLAGDDPETDLAVIKVSAAETLPSCNLNPRQSPRVGDIVLAIGNPYGVGQTVTQGIVSALGRNLADTNALQNFIQVDAAINPGNSGGALINPAGDLVGINTAVIAHDGGAEGIGFAIPTAIVNQVVSQIISHGRVIRGWLGIGVEDLILHPELYRQMQQGAVVVGVVETSPAHLSGIRRGDLVTAVNDTPIINAEQLLMQISSQVPGTEIRLSLHRPQGGELVPMELSTSLAERPRL